MGDENTKLVLLWVTYFLYMLIGAGVFMELEYKNEQQLIDRVRRSALRIKRMNFSHGALEELKTFCPWNSPRSHNRWDFAGSFYFAGTVLTTVGFGLTSPATTAGQIFFLPYALLGIPLHVLLFNTLLERTVNLMTLLLRKIYIAWRHLKCSRSSSTGNPNTWEPNTPLIALVSVVLAVLIVLVSAPLFVFLEGWNVFESIYFAVVTYTTVGFGDFVPSATRMDDGENLSIHYKIGNWIVIIVGIIFMYPAMAVMASAYKQILDSFVNKYKRFRRWRKSRNRTVDSVEAPNASQENSVTSDPGELAEERQVKFAKMVIKNWKSHSKASTMGTLNAVEDSILKSRQSPRDVHVTGGDDHVSDGTPLKLRRVPWSTGQLANQKPSLGRLNGHVNAAFHVPDNISSLEELKTTELKLHKEFKDAMHKLEEQRLRLQWRSPSRLSEEEDADHLGESRVFINVASTAGSQVGLVSSTAGSQVGFVSSTAGSQTEILPHTSVNISTDDTHAN